MAIDKSRLDKLKQIQSRKAADMTAALDAVHVAFWRMNDAQDRLAALQRPGFTRMSRDQEQAERAAIAAAEADLAAKRQAYREAEGAFENASERRDASKRLADSAADFAGRVT